jgi:hypothetical protein
MTGSGDGTRLHATLHPKLVDRAEENTLIRFGNVKTLTTPSSPTDSARSNANTAKRGEACSENDVPRKHPACGLKPCFGGEGYEDRHSQGCVRDRQG